MDPQAPKSWTEDCDARTTQGLCGLREKFEYRRAPWLGGIKAQELVMDCHPYKAISADRHSVEGIYPYRAKVVGGLGLGAYHKAATFHNG
jgi:hypothetical protein